MAQFDVHRNMSSSAGDVPFLLDVQHELLDGLATRVVVPLVRASSFGVPITRLHPVFDVDGVSVVMSTAEIAGIPCRAIGERVTSLGSERPRIVHAIDLLIGGI